MQTLLTILLLSTTTLSVAQSVDIDDPRANLQAIRMGLYPPDLIMRHQEALGISADQRKAMLKLVRQFQDDVAELQWDLQHEQQLMRADLARDSLDEAAVMPRVERVLQMESEFKRAHFKLLIAIKNTLTAEQIAMIKQRIRQRRS
ncbi:MAG: hypothetical protein R3E54_10205 [Halioglobus sp.]